MTRILTFLVWMVLAAIPTLVVSEARALERIYVVRHMEKAAWPPDHELSSLQPLSEAGAQHAHRLSTRLEDAGIAAVYTSCTTRTWSTGLMVAQRVGASIVADDATIASDQMAGFLDRLRTEHAEDRAVLLVGHSNTVTRLLEALGASDDCHEALGFFEKDDMMLIDGYDNLFVVDGSTAGCAGITVETVE